MLPCQLVSLKPYHRANMGLNGRVLPGHMFNLRHDGNLMFHNVENFCGSRLLFSCHELPECVAGLLYMS